MLRPIFDLVGAHPLHTILSAFLGAWIFNRIYISRKRNPNGLPLPPGPKGLPIIGNLLDMPTDKPWLVYHEWSKNYGDFILQLYFLASLFFWQVTWCTLRSSDNHSLF